MWTVETTTTVTVAASPVLVHSFSPTTDGQRLISYSAASGSNVRGGFICLVWDLSAHRVEWWEKTTDDIGTATTLSFSPSMVAGVVRLHATSSSGTWTVNMLTVAYTRG